MRSCCKEVREGLLDLLINVRFRSDSSMFDMNTLKMEEEKEQLRNECDNLQLVSMIRDNIQLILCLKTNIDEDGIEEGESFQESPCKGKKKKDSKALGKSISSIYKDKSMKAFLDKDEASYSKILKEMDCQKSMMSTPSRSFDGPPAAYEEIIQKLESDIRTHIRIEQ